MEINNKNKKFKVGVIRIKGVRYPEIAPYHPSESYPEYPFSASGCISHSEPNYVYQGLRELFFQLGFDKENFGKKEWNPLGSIIKPGMKVVIKPNFVLSKHKKGGNIFSIITHPSLLRALVDYCHIALKGKGEIIIADAPQYNCNFQELMKTTKLYEVEKFINSFRGPKLKILDLRNYWSKKFHFYSCLKKLPGDPEGYTLINLKKESAFYKHPNPQKLYGATFWRKETINHHIDERQEYEIANTIFNSDVLISVPKLKVHKKVGVTLNLKGLVGICSNKNLLVHYTLGSNKEGGDQYPEEIFTKKEKALIKFERWMYDHFLAKKNIFWEIPHRIIYGFLYLKILNKFGLKVPEEKLLLDRGNWYGNDSAWRMVVDLAKIIHFIDREGKMHNNFQRTFFSVIDGIIGGEGNGPLLPDPRESGVLIGGENLLAVDIVATRLMGFDPFKLKKINYLFGSKFDFGPKDIRGIIIKTTIPGIENCLKDQKNKFFNFLPHPGWIGHIEI